MLDIGCLRPSEIHESESGAQIQGFCWAEPKILDRFCGLQPPLQPASADGEELVGPLLGELSGKADAVPVKLFRIAMSVVGPGASDGVTVIGTGLDVGGALDDVAAKVDDVAAEGIGFGFVGIIDPVAGLGEEVGIAGAAAMTDTVRESTAGAVSTVGEATTVTVTPFSFGFSVTVTVTGASGPKDGLTVGSWGVFDSVGKLDEDGLGWFVATWLVFGAFDSTGDCVWVIAWLVCGGFDSESGAAAGSEG